MQDSSDSQTQRLSGSKGKNAMRRARFAVFLLGVSIASAQTHVDESMHARTGLFVEVRGGIVPGQDIAYPGFTMDGRDTTLVEHVGLGGGFGIIIGWGITPWLTTFGGFDLSFHGVSGDRFNDASYDFFEVGIIVQVPVSGFALYGLAALGSHGIGFQQSSQSGNVITIYNDMSEDSFGTSLGIGIFSGVVDINYLYSMATFSELEFGTVSNHRINLGIALWFPL